MIYDATVDLWIGGILGSVFRGRPETGVLGWAGEHCFIPPSVSPDHSGYFGIGPAPLADIMVEFYESPDWDEFFCPKSSQYGLSQMAHVIALYDANFFGRNIALALDSVPEARRVSQTRLQPMIAHCDELADKVHEDADKMANLTLMLKGLTFFLMGSHSPTALANKTIGLAIADEIDNYPEAPKGESNAVDLLRDRLKRVMGSKLIAFSKPKDDTTLIWPEFLTGSRHKCFLPCPRCEVYQEIIYEHFDYSHCRDALGEWDYEAIERDTFYRCPACGKPVEEKEKPAMIEERRWMATNGRTYFDREPGKFHFVPPADSSKAVPRKMSAHISDLYHLGPKDTWGKIMAEWVGAQGNLSKMKRVKRGRFALPWSEQALRIDKADLDLMLAGYRRGQCPVLPDVVLMASDVQKDVKKWVKAAFTISGECWVVDWGECLASATLVAEADEPVKVLHWPDEIPEDARHDPVVRKGLIDEGGGDGKENDNQGPVRDFVVSTFLGGRPTSDGSFVADYRFYSCYGRGGLAVKNWKDAFDIRPIVHKGHQLLVHKFNDDLFKRELYEERIAKYRAYRQAKKKGDDSVEKPIGLHFPITSLGEGDAVTWDVFRSELSQEERIWDSIKRRYIWKDPDEANDYGDALKMCFVGFQIMLPTLIQEKAILDRRRQIAAAEAAAAAAEKAAAASTV